MTALDALVSVVLVAIAVVLAWRGWGGKWGPAVAAVALIGATFPLARTLTGPLRAVTGWAAELAVAIVAGFGATTEWQEFTRVAVGAIPWVAGITLLVVVVIGILPWAEGTVTWRAAWAAALIPTLVLMAPPGLAKTGSTVTEAFAHTARQVGTAIVTFKSQGR